jgi:hypothetical protein
MKEEMRNGVQELSRAAKSNMKNCRKKAQEAQEQQSPFATFALFRGHYVNANSPGQLVSRTSNQSNWVKPGQTDSVGQAGGQNTCKSLTINNLQNKQPYPGQTGINLVNMVKISQSTSSTLGGAVEP